MSDDFILSEEQIKKGFPSNTSSRNTSSRLEELRAIAAEVSARAALSDPDAAALIDEAVRETTNQTRPDAS